eukprot:s2351_g6.t1
MIYWILALEVGGRWSVEAAHFVRFLACCCACAVPRPSRPAPITAFTSTWCASLVFSAANVDGDQPLFSDVFSLTLISFDETRPRSQRPGDSGGSVPREKAQELYRFGAEPAANLDADDDWPQLLARTSSRYVHQRSHQQFAKG